jgi:hypothetical protein
VSAILRIRDIPSEAAELLTACLRSCKRILGPLGDRLSFGLGDNRHDPDNHFVRFRHVCRNKLDSGILQPEQKVSVTLLSAPI